MGSLSSLSLSLWYIRLFSTTRLYCFSSTLRRYQRCFKLGTDKAWWIMQFALVRKREFTNLPMSYKQLDVLILWKEVRFIQYQIFPPLNKTGIAKAFNTKWDSRSAPILGTGSRFTVSLWFLVGKLDAPMGTINNFQQDATWKLFLRHVSVLNKLSPCLNISSFENAWIALNERAIMLN